MSGSPFADMHAELRRVARDQLAGSTPVAAGGEARPLDWDRAAALGWLGLEIAEGLDGAGATLAEVAVILKELGRAATPGPYLGSMVLGVGLLEQLEPSPGRDELLGQMAVGAARVAVALPAGGPLSGRPEPGFRLAARSGEWTVSGSADYVPDASAADRLLLPCVHPDGRLVVAAVPSGVPGLDLCEQPVVDPTRRLAGTAADRVPVEEQSLWAFRSDPERALLRLVDRAAFALACDSLGLAEAALAATVAYAAERRQFGRPIGSFQAVKHACADMHVQIRIGSQLVDRAERALLAGADDDAGVAASMAKSYVTAAAVDVAGRAVQLHGGIGYTWERGLHVYLKRAALNRTLFGAPGEHRRRLASRYPAPAPAGEPFAAGQS